ncbi:MAG TPA: hypothetical protein VGF59_31210, partial [Bryobacteraceae bacterium]
MTLLKTTLAVGGLLLGSLGMPRISYGITGCNNGYLTGTYNAQVSSVNFNNLLQSNNTGGTSGSTSGGTTGAVGSNTSAPLPGFGNNPGSLSGKIPGLSRFFFDGNGNVLGMNASTGTANFHVGSYNVANDCTARITLDTGETFDAVVVNGGSEALFLQTDASGNGAVGSLEKSRNSCVGTEFQGSSFGFQFFGINQITAASGG